MSTSTDRTARPAAPRFDKRTLARIFKEAEAAGRQAGEAHRPTPMVVVQRRNPLDDASPIVKQYAPVMDGVCGFASIIIRPGGSQAARYAKARYDFGFDGGTQGSHYERFGLGGHKAYYGGYEISVGQYGQSMERKAAYAGAFAKVLQGYGITAFAQSRMD